MNPHATKAHARWLAIWYGLWLVEGLAFAVAVTAFKPESTVVVLGTWLLFFGVGHGWAPRSCPSPRWRALMAKWDFVGLSPQEGLDRYVDVQFVVDTQDMFLGKNHCRGFLRTEGGCLVFRGLGLDVRLPLGALGPIIVPEPQKRGASATAGLWVRWLKPDGDVGVLVLKPIDPSSIDVEQDAIDAHASWLRAEVAGWAGASRGPLRWPNAWMDKPKARWPGLADPTRRDGVIAFFAVTVPLLLAWTAGGMMEPKHGTAWGWCCYVAAFVLFDVVRHWVAWSRVGRFVKQRGAPLSEVTA